ncbi:SUMF1/EgtB/PvdO family nonheme iron enzyme [Sorangium sp. So ce834]|uniref:SUMF1/EgtB/PvdO family nonheme iron enzyme n=1 Tax=Sorangium sp. So ce834 TaxID=3133321 RepID=UPI003F5F4403
MSCPETPNDPASAPRPSAPSDPPSALSTGLRAAPAPRAPARGARGDGSIAALAAAGALGAGALGAAAAVETAAHANAPAARAAAPLIAGALQERALAASAAPPGRAAPARDDEDVEPDTLEEQRLRLFARMRRELALSDEAMREVEAIFAASPVLGQGNPALSHHPMSRSECRRARELAGVAPAREPACGAPGMVPLFDPTRGQTAESAPVCIDQLEFPNIPCEYPVVHVRAREAALLCRAIGKRICDAHEWEGACAGALREPDVEYEWERPRNEASWHHNLLREKVWSYGPEKNHALCGTGSARTPGCPGGGWDRCGSNTYPAGAFPACRSRLGVFDLHGNVAEHMSLPILPDELARRGDRGFTEMKGSWFAFSSMEVHADDCRWRAPDWHATRLMSKSSHANYHLGFRCCNDIEPRAAPSGSTAAAPALAEEAAAAAVKER